MANVLKEAFKGFGWELLEGIRQTANERISDAEFEERILGIEKATKAMIEAGVNKDMVIKMLQKHWDLRLSEATTFVETVQENDCK